MRAHVRRFLAGALLFTTVFAPSAPIAADSPPARATSDPRDGARALAALQERIAHGSREALEAQTDVAREVGRRLQLLDRAVWDEPRNRTALVKFVLSGGEPSLLAAVLQRGQVPEPEIALAKGALAFAMADTGAALAQLGKLEPPSLPPSLGGHVALVLAGLVGETDPARALALCEEARLLSPGTAVEEAALRLAVTMAIAAGDRLRFERASAAHLRRYSRSPYAATIDVRIARVVAARDEAARPEGRRWLDAIGAQLLIERASAFHSELAVAALRAGRLATAVFAASKLQDSASEAPSSSALVSAASALGKDRTSARERLDVVHAATGSDELRQLVASARTLAAGIDAPPVEPPLGQVASGSPATIGKNSALGSRLDALVAQATSKLAAIDRLLQEAGS
jgi:chemotaxis protein MotC